MRRRLVTGNARICFSANICPQSLLLAFSVPDVRALKEWDVRWDRANSRRAVLEQGRIIEEGPPEAIRHSHDPVVAQFLAAGASDGTEPDFTRDRHQLTRDEICSSQMSKDELIRQLSIALSDAREVIKCAVPRSETSEWWQRDTRLLEVPKGSFVLSLEKNKAGIPVVDAGGRKSLSVRTP